MIIIGAGSLGIQICDQLLVNGHKKEHILFFDEKKSVLNNLPDNFNTILGFNNLTKALKTDNKCFIAVGHPVKRMKLSKKIIDLGGEIHSIKSNASQISNFAKIGYGYYFQPGVCIAHNVKIGHMSVIHANSIISHDVEIGDFASISQNVNIMKNVIIGQYCFIGANVVIMPNVKIGNRVLIPACSIVNQNLEDYSTL
ncbi:MAG: hypothetical protein GX879_03965 [Bacteroidales bacterium]|nr:hypothetical protein [Bacteroidales bacterium]